MDSFPAPDSCRHVSFPVETDTSMTTSSLNLAWPACSQCTGPGRADRMVSVQQTLGMEDWTGPSVTINDIVASGSSNWHEERIAGDNYDGDSEGKADISYYRAPKAPPVSDSQSLEIPQSLVSDTEATIQRPLRYPQPHCVYPSPPQCCHGYRNHCTQPWPSPHIFQQQQQCYTAQPNPRQPPQQNASSQRRTAQLPSAPIRQVMTEACPIREVMTEACPIPSFPAVQSHAPTKEMKKTITLPDKCRNLFITYSIDTADYIPTFVSFLSAQGFRPAIDIFNDPVRTLDINKWMDSYLKDKSVLIIMVLSPKYKIDIEGNGSDEHGLHTKYIYNQLQNEFIQQGCLNFRFVPVLFPSATREHIPIWLQSTRIYRWPQDTQDLLLRLLREERYIAPPMGKELTLTIRRI